LIEGDLERARQIIEETLTMAAAERNTFAIAASLDLLGDVLQRGGDVKAARRSYTGALSVYRQLGSAVGIGDVELSMGFLAERIGDLSAASAHFEQAHQAYHQAGADRRKARALFGRGLVSSSRKDRDEAQRRYQEALAISEKVGDRHGETNIRLKLAELLLSGDVQRSIGELQAVILAYRELGDQLGVANAQCLLSQADLALGSLDSAEKQLAVASDIYAQVRAPYGLSRCYELRGDLALRRGDREAALAFYAKGQAEAKHAGRHHHAAWIAFRSGTVLVDSGVVAAGLDVVKDARRVLKEESQIDALAQVDEWLERARCSLARGREQLSPLSREGKLLVEVLSLIDSVDCCEDVLAPRWHLLCESVDEATQAQSFARVLGELVSTGVVRCGTRKLESVDARRYEMSDDLARAAVAELNPRRKEQILEVLERTWRAKFLVEMIFPSEMAVRSGSRVATYLMRRRRFVESVPLLTGLLSVARTIGSPEEPIVHLLGSAAAASGEKRLIESYEAARVGKHETSHATEAFAASARAAGLYLALVCKAEEQDRITVVIDAVWDRLWQPRRVASDLPSRRCALDELNAAGLVRIEPTCNHAKGAQRYAMDAALAKHVSDVLDPRVAEGVLTSMAEAWRDYFARNIDAPDGQTVRAGLGAAVYWARVGRFEDAFDLLEHHVLPVARRTGEAEWVVPHLRRIAEQSGDSMLVARYAVLEAGTGPTSRRRLADRLGQLVRDGRLAAAVLAAEVLYMRYRDAGETADALKTAEGTLARLPASGLGLWALATWNDRRLEALYLSGRYHDVLDALPCGVSAAEAARDAEPVTRSADKLRELMLNRAVGAAKALSDWALALELNAKILASLAARNADDVTRAHYRCGDYASLLEQGDPGAADRLLVECQQVFAKAEDASKEGFVLAARGIVASRRGEHRVAIKLQEDGLRALYRGRADTEIVANSHHNYGNALCRSDAAPAIFAAHWLAAALLFDLAGSRTAVGIIDRLSAVARSESKQVLPDSVGELIRRVECVQGVRLGELIHSLQDDAGTVACFEHLLACVRGPRSPQ
jgi:tetratricopeptide (TPR) repeat protein